MVNIGVIGCGYWGPNLIRNFYEVPEVTGMSCCDLKGERLNFIKSKYPSISVTTNYQDILKNPEIDAVSIATPVNTHFQLTKEALLNDKHVLVEKPLTASSDEAKELIDLAEKKGRVLMVDHTFVYTGAVRKIKGIISTGELGDPYYYDSVRVNLGLFQQDINVLWDLAPHDISIMDYLIEKAPRKVSAVGACHFGRGIENLSYVTVMFENDLIAHFHVNWLAPVKIRTVLIGGSRKMILYDDMEPSEKVKVYDKGVSVNGSMEDLHRVLVDYRTGDMYAPKLEQTEALQLACKNFVNCIKNGTRPLTDGEAGLRVVRILEAAYQSIKNDGKIINLS